MKRFHRWLFNFATALSLLLSIGCSIVWVRSSFVAERWRYSDGVVRGNFGP